MISEINNPNWTNKLLTHTQFPWGLMSEEPVHFSVTLARNEDSDSFFLLPHDNSAAISFIIKNRKSCNEVLAKLFQLQKSLEMYLEKYDSERV